ncbi:cytochrome c biogenesis heme-transporting ATPase CcmA [Salicola sp. Rm-C-2C1-2]|uniref:cytochrome c biogenesis heme-transporting ATPase CcmA n=1 Tax=Salicola sp. Rm-C-2C1-2 TaxID=3141321 RepID=UPI0032E47DE6
MTSTLLEARQIHCERDDRPLFSGLELTVGPGDLWRIAGPNGAGKTTLLRILAGLNPAFQGELLWRGEPVHRVRAQYQANLLFLGHSAGVSPSLTAFENLAGWQAMRAPTDPEQVMAALVDAGLAGYEDLPAAQLSAGQQRRVALARLYLSSAPLWILDEAFTAVDREAVGQLEALLSNRVRAGGAVILTTHHPLGLRDVRTLMLEEDHDAV